jgi:hypothetical protein
MFNLLITDAVTARDVEQRVFLARCDKHDVPHEVDALRREWEFL